LKFRLKQVLKELFKMYYQAKEFVPPPQRYGQRFLFLSHPVSVGWNLKVHFKNTSVFEVKI